MARIPTILTQGRTPSGQLRYASRSSFGDSSGLINLGRSLGSAANDAGNIHLINKRREKEKQDTIFDNEFVRVQLKLMQSQRAMEDTPTSIGEFSNRQVELSQIIEESKQTLKNAGIKDTESFELRLQSSGIYQGYQNYLVQRDRQNTAKIQLDTINQVGTSMFSTVLDMKSNWGAVAVINRSVPLLLESIDSLASEKNKVFQKEDYSIKLIDLGRQTRWTQSERELIFRAADKIHTSPENEIRKKEIIKERKKTIPDFMAFNKVEPEMRAIISNLLDEGRDPDNFKEAFAFRDQIVSMVAQIDPEKAAQYKIEFDKLIVAGQVGSYLFDNIDVRGVLMSSRVAVLEEFRNSETWETNVKPFGPAFEREVYERALSQAQALDQKQQNDPGAIIARTPDFDFYYKELLNFDVNVLKTPEYWQKASSYGQISRTVQSQQFGGSNIAAPLFPRELSKRIADYLKDQDPNTVAEVFLQIAASGETEDPDNPASGASLALGEQIAQEMGYDELAGLAFLGVNMPERERHTLFRIWGQVNKWASSNEDLFVKGEPRSFGTIKDQVRSRLSSFENAAFLYSNNLKPATSAINLLSKMAFYRMRTQQLSDSEAIESVVDTLKQSFAWAHREDATKFGVTAGLISLNIGGSEEDINLGAGFVNTDVGEFSDNREVIKAFQAYTRKKLGITPSVIPHSPWFLTAPIPAMASHAISQTRQHGFGFVFDSAFHGAPLDLFNQAPYFAKASDAMDLDSIYIPGLPAETMISAYDTLKEAIAEQGSQSAADAVPLSQIYDNITGVEGSFKKVFVGELSGYSNIRFSKGMIQALKKRLLNDVIILDSADKRGIDIFIKPESGSQRIPLFVDEGDKRVPLSFSKQDVLNDYGSFWRSLKQGAAKLIADDREVFLNPMYNSELQ